MLTETNVVARQAQEDLFAAAAQSFEIDTSFASAKRVDLDERSWIEIVPNWMSGPQILFDRMMQVVPWREHDRKMFDKVFREPRMTAAYRTLGEVPDIGLREAVTALTNHYEVAYDGIWMNLYRRGEDSTGWHRDHPECRKLECVVPVLTLGATRKFQIKPYRGGRSLTFKPSSGDLIVMGGRCQQDWVHCVPKEPGIPGARISVNFQASSQAIREPAKPT